MLWQQPIEEQLGIVSGSFFCLFLCLFSLFGKTLRQGFFSDQRLLRQLVE